MVHHIRTVNFLCVALLAMVCVIGTASAADVTVEELEKQQRRSEESDKAQEALDKLKSQADRMERMLGRLGRTKELKCLKDFGHDRFCKCITLKTPVGFSFEQYVIAVAASRHELGYEELSGENKAMVDGSRRAREECIGTLGP